MSEQRVTIRTLDYGAADFQSALESALARENLVTSEVSGVVADILRDVRERGDAALVEYSNRFDHRRTGNG